MGYNGNGHNRCHRCGIGIIIPDGNDACCLVCGWRDSFINGNALMFYMRELVFTRLVNSREVWDDREFQDFLKEDWELAGVADSTRSSLSD